MSSSVASASSVLTSSTIRLSTLTASHSRDLAAGEHCAVPMTSSSRLNTSPLRLLYWYASSGSSIPSLFDDDDERTGFFPPADEPPTEPASLDARREPPSEGADDRGDDRGDASAIFSADVVESMRSSRRGIRST